MKTANMFTLLLALLILSFTQGCKDNSYNSPVESDATLNSMSALEVSSVDILMAKLDVSESQAENVRSIIASHIQDVKGDLPSNFMELTIEEKKEFFEKESAELKEELKSVLTDEQINKLTEMRDTFADNMKNLSTGLDLTDTQKDTVQALIQKRFGNRLNSNLTAQDRIKLRQEFRQELSQILNDQQKETFKNFIKERVNSYNSK